MKDEEVGRVTGTRIEIEDHGLLVVSVQMRFGAGGCQSFGPFCIGNESGGPFLKKLIAFFGGDTLERAVGQVVTAERDGGFIRRLRRLPCDGDAVFDAEKESPAR